VEGALGSQRDEAQTWLIRFRAIAGRGRHRTQDLVRSSPSTSRSNPRCRTCRRSTSARSVDRDISLEDL